MRITLLKRRAYLALLIAFLGSLGLASANERAFVYSYEAREMPAGSFELEQWVTWAGNKDSDEDFDRFDFREEIEYGVTDAFRLALYYDWRYEDGAGVDPDQVSFHDVAIEGLYVFTNATDPIGVALYGEAKLGDEEEFFELEAKLILTKDIGPVTIAWNGIVEAEWEEKGYEERTGAFGETLGISYELSPKWRFGVEALHELPREEWRTWGDHVAWAGPNLSYRAERFWVTIAPLVQLTEVKDEPDYLSRVIVGIDF